MRPETFLFEISWEVCNQAGGVFTYIKSKIPTMVDTYDDRYMLIGPYFAEKAESHFRPLQEIDQLALAEAVALVRSLGFEVHYGYWLLDEARPKVLLINPVVSRNVLNGAKGRFWQRFEISSLETDELRDLVLGFGEVAGILLKKLVDKLDADQDVIAHFHEWMSASCLADLEYGKVRIATVFNAHATLLGRYLASNEEPYFHHMPYYDWQQKSSEYGILPRVALERCAAQAAHVLVTNSEVTAWECELFLSRKPEYIIRNGIHRKPEGGHEVFELHLQNRQKIDATVKALITPSYPFKTDNTLYFFTSGIYEFYNKGFDITLRAIARLNEMLANRDTDISIVFFVISKQPFSNIRPDILESRQRFQDLQKICKKISQQLGPDLYSNVINKHNAALPNLNTLIDEDLHVTWREAKAEFRREGLPPAVTHLLDGPDEISSFLSAHQLDNREENKVKVFYHPDYIERATSVFSMDYPEFVRGCHLGIFPSLYEPWGYTPMEAALKGTPVITSDLSGFGRYIQTVIPPESEDGIKMLYRRYHSDDEAVETLANMLLDFADTFEREHYVPRVTLPKTVVDTVCWTELMRYYRDVYRLALMRHQPAGDLY
ncbi:glycosyltransferase [Dyadobacter sp.]|uniref:glycosyltransferase n=1 Tax=Dyadobacter sp. TaxID=1914288 RepID=UPI003F6F0553